MKIHEKVACLHTQTCHQTRAPFLEVSAKPRILRSCHQDYKNRKKKKKRYDQSQISCSPIGIDSMIKVRGRLWL